MERKRIAVLIDFENIHDFSVPKVENLDIKFYLFTGAKQKNISIELLQSILEYNKLEIIPVTSIGENALDFSLSVEMGVLHKTEEPNVEFYVLSKDRGFDFAVNYLKKKYGRKVRRVEGFQFLSPKTETTTKTTPPKVEKEKQADRSKMLNQFYQKYANFLNSTAQPISKREEGAKNQIRSFFRVENLQENEINYLYNRLQKNGFLG
ncbi:hypothetical protein ThvES_00013590 [Thiovulum sp. ES]|nr:hypothetical protein ThvES_00013590 [Thiovulum sp. ES]